MPTKRLRILGRSFVPLLALGLPLIGLSAFGLQSKRAVAAAVSLQWECRWTDRPIVIDGRKDDAAWRGAQEIDGFGQFWLGPDSRTRTATRARLLWDREYIYFHAEIEDTDVFADVKQHDGMAWQNDVFELFFKPARNKPGYYEFEINAANTQLDMFLPSRGSGGWPRHKGDHKFHMESAITVRGTINNWRDKDEGWSVEGRIPWRDFLPTGGRPEPGEEWTFALCRYDYSAGFTEPALSTCAPLQKKDYHNYEGYAPLRFIGPKRTGQSFGMEKRVPWLASRVVGSPEPPAPCRAVRVYPALQTEKPVALAAEPGGERMILIEVTKDFLGSSRLRRFSARGDGRETETLLELPDEMTYGLAFHPGFATNGFVFLGCNGPAETKPRFTRVVRYTMERRPPFRLDPRSRRVIIEWASDGHNGGDLCFGNDGMLYVTSGDGTSDSDEHIVGQNLGKLTSKVLRLDVDRPAAGRAYSIPRDNPFVGKEGVRGETWAYGLRNPWRITADRVSGQIWIGENGQDLWEYARLVERGANYGWSVFEGGHPFILTRELGPDPLTPPTLEHSHGEARSLTGGVVYRGRRMAELQGAYIYGDYSTGKLWGALHDGKKVAWQRELTDTPFAITGFAADADGEVIVIDYAGGLYRLEAAPKEQPAAPFPTKLSETGLFLSTRDLTPHGALIPYSVNSPVWADGAHKERLIALPGEGRIEFTPRRGWGFPDGAVLVQHLFLDLETGNPASRRRLETRLLTRQQGEWAGYTYLWNDAQTDATLLAAAGAEREFTIRDTRAPGGTRKQTWHYPSRAECMVCHSRASNFVLGLTESQMNKLHDYGNGRGDNQLRVLEHLGVLRSDAAAYEREVAKLKRETDTLQRAAITNSVLLPRAPKHLRRLADPADATAGVETRVRSYLQANCAHCHIRSGGGNSEIELEFITPAAEMKLVNARPRHYAFSFAEARLVAPGSPERSVLWHRISQRGPGQMPPLASTVADAEAVALIREWIASMKPQAAATSARP